MGMKKSPLFGVPSICAMYLRPRSIYVWLLLASWNELLVDEKRPEIDDWKRIVETLMENNIFKLIE